jgi:hypothetical protein
VLGRGPDAVLRDLFRAIRPGGELRFYEHVQANEPKLARFQDIAVRVWPFFAGGKTCRRFPFKPCFFCTVAPRILGVARRPSVNARN